MRTAFEEVVLLLQRANPDQRLDELLNDEGRCGLKQITCSVDGSSEWVRPELEKMYSDRGIKSLGGRQGRAILRVRGRGRADTLHATREAQRSWLESSLDKTQFGLPHLTPTSRKASVRDTFLFQPESCRSSAGDMSDDEHVPMEQIDAELSPRSMALARAREPRRSLDNLSTRV